MVNDSVYSIRLEYIDQKWDTLLVDHLDIIHEILTKSVASSVSSIYAIEYNQIKQCRDRDGFNNVAALLNMLNSIFYRTTEIDMSSNTFRLMV